MFDFLLKKRHHLMPDYKMAKLQCHNTGQFCCTSNCVAYRTVSIHNELIEVPGQKSQIRSVRMGYCADLLEIQ